MYDDEFYAFGLATIACVLLGLLFITGVSLAIFYLT